LVTFISDAFPSGEILGLFVEQPANRAKQALVAISFDLKN
jgi:hypothetical protein